MTTAELINMIDNFTDAVAIGKNPGTVEFGLPPEIRAEFEALTDTEFDHVRKTIKQFISADGMSVSVYIED
jgi:Ni,Fe-hydrogenase maturation factor